MFKVGELYKVKIEFPGGQVGFGRAHILAREGGRYFVIVKGTREDKQHPPLGSRIYLVGNYQDNAFNGLWSAKVVGEKIIDGATASELSAPKFTPIQQRRRATRVQIDCPVSITREDHEESIQAVTRNISSTGIAIAADDRLLNDLLIGECVAIAFKTKFGQVEAKCRTVRTDYDWLANRSDAGLEFVELEPKFKANLESLLSSLGAWSDKETASEDVGNMPRGLSGWVKSSKTDTSYFKKGKDPDEDESQEGNSDE